MLGFYNLGISARNNNQAGTGWITPLQFSHVEAATGLAAGVGRFTPPDLSRNLSAKQIWSYVTVIAMCLWLVGAGFLQTAAADYINILARSAAWDKEMTAQTQSHNNLNLGQLPNIHSEAATTQRGTDTSADAPQNTTLNGLTAPQLNPLPAPQQITPQSSGASLTGNADAAHLGGYINANNVVTGVVANQLTVGPVSWNSNQPLGNFGTNTKVVQMVHHSGNIVALVDDGSLWKSPDGVSWYETYNPIDHSYPISCYINLHPAQFRTMTPQISQLATIGDSGSIYVSIKNAGILTACDNLLPSDVWQKINNGTYIANGIYVTSDGSSLGLVQAFNKGNDQATPPIVEHGGLCDEGDATHIRDASGIGIDSGGNLYVAANCPNPYFNSSNELLGSFNNFTAAITTTLLGVGVLSTYPSVGSAYITINGDIYKANNTNLTSLNIHSDSESVSRLAEDSKGLWVASAGNLSTSSNSGANWQVVPVTVTHNYTDTIVLTMTNIQAVVRSQDGTIWLGQSLNGGSVETAAKAAGSNTWVDETGNLGSIPSTSGDNLGKMSILTILPGKPDPACGCAVPSTESPNIPTHVPQVNNFRPNPNTGGTAFSVQGLPQTSPPEAPNLNLSFSASFNSFNTFQPSPMAAGWHHNFDYKLQELPSGAVNIMQPSGRIDSYQPLGGGQYTTPRRTDAQLVKNGDGSFSLTQLDKTVYSFSASASGGLVTRIQDRNANFIDFTYDTNNLLTKARLCLGTNQCPTNTLKQSPAQAITLTYTAGQLTGVIDQAQRSVQYGYDSLSRLITITDVRQQPAVLSYTAGNLVHTIKDANGNLALTLDYDQGGRLVKYTDAQGSYGQFDYSVAGMTIYTDTRQNATTYYYDSLGRTTQVYDPYHNFHAYQYDSRDHTTQFTNPNGAKTYTTYDAGGIGLPIFVTSTVTVNGALQVYTTATHYNTQNQPDVITNARGYATHISYDASGNRPVLMTDAAGNQTGYTYGNPYHPNLLTVVTTTQGNVQTNYYYDLVGYPRQIVQTFSTLLTSGGSPTSLQQTSRTTNYTYDTLGRLVDQSDGYYGATAPNPLPHTHYDYDPAGNLLTTTNQLGQQASTIYDAVGVPNSSTNFMGQQTNYGHDVLNRIPLEIHLGPGGSLIQSSYATTYDAAGNISTTTNHNGVTTYYSYDNLNRLSRTQTPLQAGGYLTTIDSYDAAGNLASIRQTNTGAGLSGDQITAYAYDEWNRVVTTTYGSNNLNYQQVTLYDGNNNVVTTKRSLGAASPATNWNDPTQVVTTTSQYDPLDRPQSTTSLALAPGGGYTNLTTTYSYNDTLLLATATDPFGISSSSQSDGLGRAISQTAVPASPANGAQVQSSYTFYDANNLSVRTIDPVGNWTDSGYDLIHRPTSRTFYTLPGGGGTALTSQTFYTDAVLPQLTTLGPVPYYQRQDTFMDALNRPITTTTYTSNGNANIAVVPSGALNTFYGYDDEGNLTKLTDSRGNLTRYGYENPNWLKIVTQTVTSNSVLQTLTTTYTYDYVGNLLRTTDANSHTASQISHYDVLNRLTDEYDALGNGWHTYYDGLSRITGKQDAKGQLTSYYYDNSSRLISFTTASAITTAFTYNAGGRPLTMVDRVGAGGPVTTNYSYDGLNRLMNVTNPQGVVGYGYDAANRRTALNFGPATNPTQQGATYGYDGLSRPLAITNTGYVGTPQVLTYNYNNGPRLAAMNYPNGVAAAYSFDGAGRLTNITQTKGANTLYQAQYTLDQLGNRTGVSEIVSNTSRQVGYGYDELSRLNQEIPPTGGPYQVTSYDKVGNLKSETFGHNYTYDNADRLVSGSDSAGNTYSYNYDANGSLLTNAQTPPTGDCNTPPTGSGTSVTKPCGATTTYTYDVRNRLTNWQTTGGSVLWIYAQICSQIAHPTGSSTTTAETSGGSVGAKSVVATTATSPASATSNSSRSPSATGTGVWCAYPNSTGSRGSYTYDGANTRLSQSYQPDIFGSSQVTTTSYLQDVAGGLPVVLSEGSGTVTTTYLYPLGSTSPLLAAQGGVGAYYHDDGLGSVRALSDASSGALVGAYSYNAFGTDAGSSQSGVGLTLNQSHRFAGEQLDPSGLYYNRARYYDSSLGSFVERDSWRGTSQAPLTQDRYTYVEDEPVNLADPSGFAPTDPYNGDDLGKSNPCDPRSRFYNPQLCAPLAPPVISPDGPTVIFPPVPKPNPQPAPPPRPRDPNPDPNPNPNPKPPSPPSGGGTNQWMKWLLLLLTLTVTATLAGSCPDTRQRKMCNTIECLRWKYSFARRLAIPPNTPQKQYQVAVTGSQWEYHAAGGGVTIWADNIDCTTCCFEEAKYIDNPTRTPFQAHHPDEDLLYKPWVDQPRQDVRDEISRYRAIIEDPTTPVICLRMITNNQPSQQYFRNLIAQGGVPGDCIFRAG